MLCCAVAVAPKLEYDARYSSTQEVKAGGTLLLPVSFTGTGSPRVRWFRDGTALLPVRGHVHMDSGDHHSTLTLLGTEQHEGGAYQCLVENEAGEARHTFNVVVRGEPADCAMWNIDACKESFNGQPHWLKYSLRVLY